jgi:signal recognition particle receptor subunit beta
VGKRRALNKFTTSEFIRSVSDLGPDELPNADPRYYNNGLVGVETPRCTLGLGRIKVTKQICIYLVEIPTPVRFDYHLLEKDIEILGFILILDSVDPSEFRVNDAILRIYRYFYDTVEPIPYVIVANKQDHSDAWDFEDLRIVCGVKKHEKFLPCNSKDKESVKLVLLELLYTIKDSIAE